MSGASRPTRPDDLTPEESGGKPTNPSAAPAPSPSPSDACAGSRGAHSSSGLQIRPSSRSPRRSSSGYFSYDSESLPGSPLSPRPLTADRATQTPSPSAQAVEHALDRLDGLGEGAHRRQDGRSASSTDSDSMRDMQAVLIGQELRRHGDEFNRILLQRRQAAGEHPQWWPAAHQEPTVFICVGLLMFFFGRLLYTHSATYSRSQV